MKLTYRRARPISVSSASDGSESAATTNVSWAQHIPVVVGGGIVTATAGPQTEASSQITSDLQTIFTYRAQMGSNVEKSTITPLGNRELSPDSVSDQEHPAKRLEPNTVGRIASQMSAFDDPGMSLILVV